MSFVNYLPMVLGILGLMAAFFVYTVVKAYPAGTTKVTEIGDEIHQAAMVFMRREYSILAIFCAVVLVLVLIFALILWLLDSGLSWLVSLLIG